LQRSPVGARRQDESDHHEPFSEAHKHGANIRPGWRGASKICAHNRVLTTDGHGWTRMGRMGWWY
jgi:hypothetical protein